MESKNSSVLDHLPKLPALDEPTQALFDAIAKRDVEQVSRALDRGARLDKPQPFKPGSGGNDVEGGMLPLQAACTTAPQAVLPMDIIKTLVERGADVNGCGIDDPCNSPLGILAQRLPQNAPGAIAFLSAHGATPTIEMVKQVLVSHRAWIDQSKPVQYFEGALDALWDAMPESEKKKMTPEWIMAVVPNDTAPLDYQQIKKIQWLSNRCTVAPQSTFKDRIDDRRGPGGAEATSPRHKLH